MLLAHLSESVWGGGKIAFKERCSLYVVRELTGLLEVSRMWRIVLCVSVLVVRMG